MEQKHLNQLNNAVTSRCSQDQVLWTIFGTFWAAEAILLVALFNTGKLPDHIVGLLVSAVGILLSIAWYTINARTILHLIRFENLIERLEKKLGIETELAISLKINTVDKIYISRNHKTPVRIVMRCCSVGSIILWGASLVCFFCSTIFATHCHY